MYALLKSIVAKVLGMRTLSLVCYGLLASQSGFLLWMLWKIKTDGVLIAIEPRAAILNAEIAMTGLVLLVALVMFVRQRLTT